MKPPHPHATLAPDRRQQRRALLRRLGAERALRTPWPTTGFVQIQQILTVIPVSTWTWWIGIKDGRFPQPVHVCGRSMWRVSDIDALIARLSTAGGDGHPTRRPPPPGKGRKAAA